MRCLLSICLSFVIIFLMTFSLAYPGVDTAVFHIPRVEGINVDGSGDDWTEQGFRVGFLADPDGRVLPAEDFDVQFRIGWSEQGLYVLAKIYDDIAVEHENLSRLWRCDCVEIFVAEKVGSTNRYQLVLTSGADSKYKKVRSRLYDWRPENKRHIKLTTQLASQVFKGGYVVEMLLPWENLGIAPNPGIELAFQFVANDDDGNAEDSNGSLRVAWFPSIASHTDPTMMYSLCLAEDPSEPILLRVDRKIEISQSTITVQGAKELIGEQAVVRFDDELVTQKKLIEKNGRANAVFHFNTPKDGNAWPQLSIDVSGNRISTFEKLPTLEWILERYIEAIGGSEAVERLKTRSCTGNYMLDNSSQNTFAFTATAKIPDKWTISIHNPNWTEKNGFDGTMGWKQDSDRIERMDRLARSTLGWWLNPQGPIQLQKYFPNFVLKKKDIHEGHAVFLVESNVFDGVKHTLEFDAENGLLSRIDNHWILKDYRKIDGIQLPFSLILNRRRGPNIFTLIEVKHNVTIDEGLFAMPDPSEVFADAFQGIDDPKVLPMLKMKDLTYKHGEMNIPCRDGRFLYDLIVRNGYNRGLEIGTYNGYSTLWMGLAFKKTGGKVITIEIDSVSGQDAQRNFRKAALEDVIDSRINDAFVEIEKIPGKFDFIFIDANKEDYGRFFRLLKDRISLGGAIVGHNVINYARDMRDFLNTIQNDPDFETTIHKTSAEGISVSIKRNHK